MHNQVLSASQKELLPLLSKFQVDFGLVGGTAIALQLGYRKSIDFDLFTNTSFDAMDIRRKIKQNFAIDQTIIDSNAELTLIIEGVKVTFYHYPYHLVFDTPLLDVISMSNLKTLAAMKAFALGRRAKWKDYVDMYFLIKELSFDSIVKECSSLFGAEFNEKLFRSQLSFFEDIDYSEEVHYLIQNSPTQEEVRAFLENVSIS